MSEPNGKSENFLGADGEMSDRMLCVSDGLATTDMERNRKLLQCLRALRMVQEDLGFMSLDDMTRKAVDDARIPIGGWEKGLARIKQFLNEDEDC